MPICANREKEEYKVALTLLRYEYGFLDSDLI